MVTSLPKRALTQKYFPFDKTFSSPAMIQDFAKKFLLRFFMEFYQVDPLRFSNYHPEYLFLTGFPINPTRSLWETELWYVWCLTALYASYFIIPVQQVYQILTDPDQSTSLMWTLFEWFNPLPWWRMKFEQLQRCYNLNNMPPEEAKQFVSVFIVHRPYFQHPVTNLFWTQNQVYEWKTVPHIHLLEYDPENQTQLKQFLFELNHITPPSPDISHTSIGPQHNLIMVPEPSSRAKPPSRGILLQEERPDYTDVLFQDSQDYEEEFTPLNDIIHLPSPTIHPTFSERRRDLEDFFVNHINDNLSFVPSFDNPGSSSQASNPPAAQPPVCHPSDPIPIPMSISPPKKDLPSFDDDKYLFPIKKSRYDDPYATDSGTTEGTISL